MKNAKEVAVFVVGSNAFFDGMDGFCSKDKDYVHLFDDWFPQPQALMLRKDSSDRFLYPNKGLELIDDCIRQNDPLTAGKFLVPEFCEYIGATLNDIKKLENLFFALDDKHKYETYIYECYIKNSGLWLTEKQRIKAFEIYRQYRT